MDLDHPGRDIGDVLKDDLSNVDETGENETSAASPGILPNDSCVIDTGGTEKVA